MHCSPSVSYYTVNSHCSIRLNQSRSDSGMNEQIKFVKGVAG